jgi:hypothetical protein
LSVFNADEAASSFGVASPGSNWRESTSSIASDWLILLSILSIETGAKEPLYPAQSEF